VTEPGSIEPIGRGLRWVAAISITILLRAPTL
jgi:hypothetical protein